MFRYLHLGSSSLEVPLPEWPSVLRAAAESDLHLVSAEALFDRYSEETESWPFPSSDRPPFQRLTAECALLMRKFKPPTINEAIALFQSPLYRSWNYTGSTCEWYNCKPEP